MEEVAKKSEKILKTIKEIIPLSIFRLFQPIYHWTISWIAALFFGFPSRSMKVIGITGTKGKSTTAFMIAKIFEDQGKSVAVIGSLGIKINKEAWPNTLKMTMPGRFYLQKFIAKARAEKVDYLVLEVTSEGIAQHRLNGIHVDCAVFTNLHKEHIESHGSFGKYMDAKKMLFKKTKDVHIINIDNKYSDEFVNIFSRNLVTFGMTNGDVNQKTLELKLKLSGEFNIYNALASIAVANVYGLDLMKAKDTVDGIELVPGRMEYIKSGQSFEVVVDYAHTPESLEGVYQTLKSDKGRLIGVLGAAGGGRDTWKRPVFGELGHKYCDILFLTNEDPYEEDQMKIIEDIKSGMRLIEGDKEVRIVLDREKAIEEAIMEAKDGDTVVITGKGSEVTMALAGGNKIPWSDKDVAKRYLEKRGFIKI